MSKRLHIARAQQHEIPAVLALIEALLAELGGEGQEFAGFDRDKLFRDLHHDLSQTPEAGRFIALLALDESGTPVGVLTLSPCFAVYAGGEYGIVQEMYVLPAHRGMGVGRMLVESAAAFARERQWCRLDVTCPEDDSGEVVRFYERMGFTFTGSKLRLLVSA